MSEPTPSPDHRAIDLSVEVTGTPEQVWQAIATGPGINAWFVPAQVDGQEGGKLTLDFADMGQASSVITAWEPPHRYEARWDEHRSGASMALELLVEARDGGTCVVRLVNSGFGAGAEWDDELDQTTAGWAGFLHNLELYLARFAPRPAAKIFVHGGSTASHAAAWTGLLGGLGLPAPGAGLEVGEHVATSDDAVAAGAPRLSGVVDRLVGGTATLVLDEPAEGYAIVAAEGPGGGVFLNLSAYLFGDDAAAVAVSETPRWQAWMAEHFAHPEPEG